MTSTFSLGKKIFLDTVDSTNNYLNNLLKQEEVPEGTIVWTAFQTRGKGYSGSIWESERGKNLLMSILLRPVFLRPDSQFNISRIISIALQFVIKKYCKGVTIKWPNDIYVENRKIAGILIENVMDGNIVHTSVAGIGLNVNQKKFGDNISNPTSLFNETGCHFDMIILMEELVDQIAKWYDVLYDNKSDLIEGEYAGLLYGKGRWMQFSANGEDFRGMIMGTEPTGELIIESENGDLFKFGFKEVEYR